MAKYPFPSYSAMEPVSLTSRGPAKTNLERVKEEVLTEAKANAVEQSVLEDGTKVFKNRDGTYTQEQAGGVLVQRLADGSIKQTMPNGVVIEANADSSVIVQTNTDGVKIEQKDGARTTIFPDGMTIKVFENGEKLQRNADGVEIFTHIDGKKVQTKGDLILTTFPDGRMEQLDTKTGDIIYTDTAGNVLPDKPNHAV